MRVAVGSTGVGVGRGVSVGGTAVSVGDSTAPVLNPVGWFTTDVAVGGMGVQVDVGASVGGIGVLVAAGLGVLVGVRVGVGGYEFEPQPLTRTRASVRLTNSIKKTSVCRR